MTVCYLGILELSSQYLPTCERLKACSRQIIKLQFKAVSTSDEFLNLSSQTLKHILTWQDINTGKTKFFFTFFKCHIFLCVCVFFLQVLLRGADWIEFFLFSLGKAVSLSLRRSDFYNFSLIFFLICLIFSVYFL